MLIANTTDQKFLEAILSELKKTNELLGTLCSMRKDAEDKPRVTAESLFPTHKKTENKSKRTTSKKGGVSSGNSNKRTIQNS